MRSLTRISISFVNTFHAHSTHNVCLTLWTDSQQNNRLNHKNFNIITTHNSQNNSFKSLLWQNRPKPLMEATWDTKQWKLLETPKCGIIDAWAFLSNTMSQLIAMKPVKAQSSTKIIFETRVIMNHKFLILRLPFPRDSVTLRNDDLWISMNSEQYSRP